MLKIGVSDKTSCKLIFVNPSALPKTTPELPASHAPLPGDDEAACLPSPVSMLTPLVASKHPVGALSPTDVALFLTSAAPPEA